MGRSPGVGEQGWTRPGMHAGVGHAEPRGLQPEEMIADY